MWIRDAGFIWLSRWLLGFLLQYLVTQDVEVFVGFWVEDGSWGDEDAVVEVGGFGQGFPKEGAEVIAFLLEAFETDHGDLSLDKMIDLL